MSENDWPDEGDVDEPESTDDGLETLAATGGDETWRAAPTESKPAGWSDHIYWCGSSAKVIHAHHAGLAGYHRALLAGVMEQMAAPEGKLDASCRLSFAAQFQKR